MEERFLDTYFFDSKLALDVSLKRNQVKTNNPNIRGLQICYYAGKALKKSPKNCIHVPLEQVYSYFSTTNNRFPKFVNFTNTDFTNQDKVNFNENLTKTLSRSVAQNHLLVEEYKKKIRECNPNFETNELRIFISACRETVVMQHISQNIAKSFKKLGYKVKFYIQKSQMEACGALKSLKAHYKFNPHITVNINHLNNQYLNEYTYNFTWFQDYMDTFKDSKKIKLRKRDYIFTLFDDMKKILVSKSVKKCQIQTQPFCINTSIYKQRKKIKRENKLVFIGSSYKQNYDNVPISMENKSKILKELLKIYKISGSPSEKVKEKICKKYDISSSYNLGHIINYIERDITIKNIIKSNPTIKFELYGYGWEKDDFLCLYNKGVVNQGKDISKIYNSAKFALVSGGYILQQRTLEATASGSIPVVLDVRKSKDRNKSIQSAMLFFKTPQEITKLLQNGKAQNLDILLAHHSYIKLAKKMISIIKE